LSLPRRYTKNSYCSYCGHAFAPDQSWPRRCAACGSMTFQNPLPVTVLLQPVGDGLLVVRRAIEPHRGVLAFPGGFIDLGESWQQAGARELAEEAGMTIDPRDIRLVRVFSAPDGTIIICGLAPRLAASDLPPFTPTAEASAREILTGPAPLAWPLHNELAEAFFGGALHPCG
jgi:ADP-ribose pyrophosphatase YjhB (NUDIX family)